MPLLLVLANVAIKLNVYRNVMSRKLPRIQVEPIVGHFDLISVDDILLENSVPVA